jgi:peptidoglycan hydrolase CwlO-like protein
MTEETSVKQTGAMSHKRPRVEDEEDDEEYEGQITRKMAEPEWMKRIDKIGKNVGTFTERVENFEQRMKDKERIEWKWQEKTTEALNWQKGKLNSLWRLLKDMTDVVDEIDAAVANKKVREVEVQTEVVTEKAEVEVEEMEKEAEEKTEETGEAEEKPEEVEEKAEESDETEAEDGENEEDGEEVEETEETLNEDVEMAEV